MSEKINGQSAYLAETVDPDESPDRADTGYTGVDPQYQNAATKAYAPQGKMSLVPSPTPVGGNLETVVEPTSDTQGDATGESKSETPATTPAAPAAPVAPTK